MTAHSDPIGDQVGDRIRGVRKRLNLKQQEFAGKLNISGTSLSEIETGKYKPGCDFLINMYREYGANIYYILFGRGEMFLDPTTQSFLEAEDYALNLKDVREFLYYFQRSPMLQYYILSQYKGKMLVDREFIQKEAALPLEVVSPAAPPPGTP